MSKTAKEVLEETWVATLATNSLLEILKIYVNEPYQIKELRAFSSHSLEDIPYYLNDEIGIKTFKEKDINSFNINYKINFDKKTGNPTNPITPVTITLIENKLNELSLTDASVDTLKVIFKDKKLGKLLKSKGYLKTDEEEFLMELISDPVDDDKDKAIVREFPVNETLIKFNRFQYRVMHVRKLIDLRQIYTVATKTKLNFIINWTGHTIRSVKSPTVVAQHLKEHHLGEYGFLKRYGSGAEEVLVLLSVIK